jgi:hypothetical protein
MEWASQSVGASDDHEGYQTDEDRDHERDLAARRLTPLGVALAWDPGQIQENLNELMHHAASVSRFAKRAVQNRGTVHRLQEQTDPLLGSGHLEC